MFFSKNLHNQTGAYPEIINRDVILEYNRFNKKTKGVVKGILLKKKIVNRICRFVSRAG